MAMFGMQFTKGNGPMSLFPTMRAFLLYASAFLLQFLSSHCFGSPLDDLHSVDPNIRAQAARVIRTGHVYTPSSCAQWEKLLRSLKSMQTSAAMLKALHDHGIASDIRLQDLTVSAVYKFRINADWVFLCAINQSEFTEIRLVNEPEEVFVPPPTGYTGLWRCYRLNGEPMPYQYYSKGKSLGHLAQ
jgi:hypothetical protein